MKIKIETNNAFLDFRGKVYLWLCGTFFPAWLVHSLFTGNKYNTVLALIDILFILSFVFDIKTLK